MLKPTDIYEQCRTISDLIASDLAPNEHWHPVVFWTIKTNNPPTACYSNASTGSLALASGLATTEMHKPSICSSVIDEPAGCFWYGVLRRAVQREWAYE